MTQENTDDYVDFWVKNIPDDLKDQTDAIVTTYRYFVLRYGYTKVSESQDLFTRAIVEVANENMPWEYSLTEIIGRWIDNTSDNKKVRKEIEDIYFELLADEAEVKYDVCRNVLLKAVKEYNRRHGYLGWHKRD
jgi:hypothetical protein